jgi:hypothetical protein
MNKWLVAFPAFWAFLVSACHQIPKEPNVAEVVKEESRSVAAWSGQLVQRQHGPPNSDAILLDLSIVDSTGSQRLLAKDLLGPVLVFEAERKIVSCESSGTMVGVRPIVIDLNGRQVVGPDHPGYLRQCKEVEDSNLAFLHYNLVRQNKPYNLVRMIDTDGRLVFEKEMSTIGEVEVRAAGRTYQVHVPEPEWPG